MGQFPVEGDLIAPPDPLLDEAVVPTPNAPEEASRVKSAEKVELTLGVSAILAEGGVLSLANASTPGMLMIVAEARMVKRRLPRPAVVVG